MPAPPPNAMTVDVEDWFQVQAFAHSIDRAAWDSLPRRVETNTHRLLDLFAETGVHATFFALGWVAERHPALVRRIVADGHELASHGHGHRLVHDQTPAEFAQDIAHSRRLLEDTGGVPVRGYRAPTFSVSTRTPWAFDILAEQGYRYSSSTYPIRHDLYGTPNAPRAPYKPNAALTELPLTTLRLAGRNIPCAGGGYFRLLPYTLSRAALRRAAHAIFYTHPWEIDPAQPRVTAAPVRARFRHYLNLGATYERLQRLLEDFTWERMDNVFAEHLKE